MASQGKSALASSSGTNSTDTITNSLNGEQRDVEFDYENIKTKYYKNINQYFYVRPKLGMKRWTKMVVEATISVIKEGIFLDFTGRRWPDSQVNLKSKYYVLQENGKDILVLKKKTAQNGVIQVIAEEDYFDVMLEAHTICEHGGIEKTTKLIKNLYHIPEMFIKRFLRICNVCMLNEKATVPKVSPVQPKRWNYGRFNCTAQIGFVNMKKEPDGTFDHIMYYVDKMTHFIIIRAIISNKNEFEVSMELLKIFLDFGPPRRIETYHRALLQRSISLLERTWPIWDISVVQLDCENVVTSIHVSDVIHRWMLANKTKNWAIGCRMVQFQMNTTKISGKSFTPYSSVFGFNSNSIPFSSSEISDIEIETIELGRDISSDILPITDNNDKMIIDEDIQCVSQTLEEKLSDQNLEAKEDSVKGESHLQELPKGLMTDGPKKCHVCKIEILKPQICSQCKNIVHMLCCDRLFVYHNDHKQDLDTVCLLCRNKKNKEALNT